MSPLNKIIWNSIKCSKHELRLDISLKCGQSFRWKSLEIDDSEEKVFIGVIKQNLLLFKQDDLLLHYYVAHGSMTEEAIKDYFNLGVDLQALYKQWSQVDPIFDGISVDYPGVRMLRQEPVENLFSFICSANNNIQRISGMVENMAKEYGDKVEEFADIQYFSFPTIHKLAQPGVEAKLRELGFGYRAKYIEESAKKIIELGGEDWLFSLRQMSYEDAKKNLVQLSGIGPKVADCILLMSLDQPSSIPVDTHVFQIAQRYLPHLKQNKTVTTKVYAEIGDHFRKLYGPYAGWAHSVLFSADLKHLQDLKQNSPEKKGLKSPGKNKVKKDNTSAIKNEVNPPVNEEVKSPTKKETKSTNMKEIKSPISKELKAPAKLDSKTVSKPLVKEESKEESKEDIKMEVKEETIDSNSIEHNGANHEKDIITKESKKRNSKTRAVLEYDKFDSIKLKRQKK